MLLLLASPRVDEPLYIACGGRCMHVISTHNEHEVVQCEVTSLLYIVGRWADKNPLIRPLKEDMTW
jgi:hypothetical protein